MWGAIRHQGLLEGTVVISDGAGQFRIDIRGVLGPRGRLSQTYPGHRRAASRRRCDAAADLVFYADLKAYRLAPCPKRAAAMRARFNRIFTPTTGFELLDKLLRRLHKQKPTFYGFSIGLKSRSTPTVRKTTSGRSSPSARFLAEPSATRVARRATSCWG